MDLLGTGITRASGFRSFSIPSTSMESTIRVGDHLIADARYYDSRPPARQDLVIFKHGDLLVVKRVIAIGGDIIQGKDGNVILNGQEIDEPYVQHVGSPFADPAIFGEQDWRRNFGPTKVPEGEYFVMGDNRDYSLDSRDPQVGSYDRTSVVGKALYVF
ncbi:MAG: signal peptidase I, partial [Candidatus Sulfotelmatobacter sp.]